MWGARFRKDKGARTSVRVRCAAGSSRCCGEPVAGSRCCDEQKEDRVVKCCGTRAHKYVEAEGGLHRNKMLAERALRTRQGLFRPAAFTRS